VAINEQSNATTACKFQYFRFFFLQRGEMLIFIFLILTLLSFLSEFGVRCVGNFYASDGEKIEKEMSFFLHAHAYTNTFLFRVPQVLET